MKEVFQNDLLENEEILWTGQPLTRVFSIIDIFLIPFSLIWGGFAISWEFTAIHSGAPLFFCLFGIPFVLVGLYITFGRFIYKYVNLKNTYYAVTNQRVLILSGIYKKTLQGLFMDQIPNINKTVNINGSGTLRFGITNANRSENTGMEIFDPVKSTVAAFLNIEDVGKVYRLINNLR
ncbi:MAG: PH domain-containing protein [Clostridia bacterium]|nr:PH domain-containing protein [Clostridia bacterium]